ncbi:MAG: hypothetical protein FJ161_03450 [Gammaproteobacteria bacterium]|nr:hypothetical protein [Gammaproteobacteria bacterium]
MQSSEDRTKSQTQSLREVIYSDWQIIFKQCQSLCTLAGAMLSKSDWIGATSIFLLSTVVVIVALVVVCASPLISIQKYYSHNESFQSSLAEH